MHCCFQWFKDTNLKANHNLIRFRSMMSPVVSNGSKILIWKQITTHRSQPYRWKRCFQWFKDTNLKANHNDVRCTGRWDVVVSNGSKILIWKQITTYSGNIRPSVRCFQWFKDTNLKANHNKVAFLLSPPIVVSNGSKILIKSWI